MTVSTTLNKVIYPGSGAQTTFSFSFAFPGGTSTQEAANIQVFYTDTLGNITLLTAGSGATQYQISFNPASGTNPTPVGGVVTYNPSGVPIALGTFLTILRSLPLTQATSLQNQGTLYQPVTEAALDYEMMVSQQVLEVQSRALVVPVSDPPPAPVPTVAARKNQGAVWDGSGNLIAGVLPATGVISSAMAPVTAASSIAAALTLLGIGPLATIPGGTKGQIIVKNSSTAGDGSWFNAQWLNIETYGGKGDNSTDNTAALNAALAALASQGGGVYFPPGKYKFNSQITFNFPSGLFSVTLVGAGADATELTWPNAVGGLIFNFNGINSSCHGRDLTLSTGVVNGGNAVALNLATSVANPAVFAQSDFYRVTCRGSDGYSATNYWTNGFIVANVSNIIWDGSNVYGASTPNGNGINLIGLPASSTYSVQYNIAKGALQSLNQGVVYGSFIQGVTIDQVNFTATNSGVISPAAQTGTLAQLAVTNCQFNPTASGFGIVTNTAITETQVTDCLFEALANNVTCISLVLNNHFNINGNEFGASASFTGTTAISIGTTSAGATGTIQGNDLFAFGTGITLAAGAVGCAVMGNTINNAAGHGTTIIVNNSSSITNWIASNPGYNPVGPAAITVGGSPFTYTAGATPETVYVIGGTVTSVTFDKNGGTLGVVAASSASAILNGTFELGPWDQIKVTYGSAPSMNKMIH